MRVYAGIDEAGYGPSLGPMVIGCSVFRIDEAEADGDATPDLWRRMRQAVCRDLTGRRWRVPVNDSKKLTSKAAGLRHLELGCLAFAHLAGRRIAAVDQWLAAMGAEVSPLPWYEPTDDRPWAALPGSHTYGEIAVAANMLGETAQRAGVELLDLGAAVICEDQFNELVARTHNKAAVSFHRVVRHIDTIWRACDGHDHVEPIICIDRQGGRTRYREPLQQSFPEAQLAVLEESASCSVYRMQRDGAAVTVRFEIGAEQRHLPVALASMLSKYTRELLMERFNGWWCRRIVGLRPTAGYARDAQRWLSEVRGELARLGVREAQLCRRQ